MHSRIAATIVFGFLFALAAGCGDDGDPAVCEPGATQGCRCPGGASGVQICLADRSGWGACDCSSADADADADDAIDVAPDSVAADADADADAACVLAECEASCPHTGGPPYGYCDPERGCVCTHPDPPPDADADADADVDADVPPPPARETVDLLVMVDNSPSMDEEQAQLVSGMPAFLDALFANAATAGLDLSLNVGVVSSDMGTDGIALGTCPVPLGGDHGCLLHTPRLPSGCGTTYPAFLSRTASTAGSYTTAEMAADFACVGTLGTGGCGFEQSLESAVAALTTNAAVGECNEGFLRADSTVAVLVLSDEDDCSVAPTHSEIFDGSRSDLGQMGVRCFLHPDFLTVVSEFVTALTGLETAGHALFVASIVGVPTAATPGCTGFGEALADCLEEPAMTEAIDPADPARLLPACTYAGGRGSPGRRFVQVAEALGHRAHVSSICESDYTPALTAVADALF
jgi:hypothetical protein